ncbi:MAG: MarR family transcriptional regulator for hemolysin [Paracoccaceae bacterium]|jgi:MarR family transcriptional regulator for hemolysin
MTDLSARATPDLSAPKAEDDTAAERVFTADSLGFVIQDVARLLRGAFLARVAETELDLTVGEARALVHVSGGIGMRQTAIAERMGVEPMTFCGFVDKLEGRGLVERQPHPDDRRAKQVIPTEAGCAALTRFAPLSRSVLAEATEDLTADEIDLFRSALLKMRSRLSAPQG